MIKKIYSRIIGSKFSASEFPEVYIGGKKLSRTKCKEFIKGLAKDRPLSAEEMTEDLREAGLGGSQTKTSQRKGIISTIFGQGKKKPTKEELREEKAAIKRRIAGSRYTAESDIGQLGGVAGRLRSRDKESTLNRILTKDAGDKKGGKMKIGADDLNVHREETRVAALGGGGASASAHPTAHLGGDSGLGQHTQPPIGFNRMG